MAAVTVRMFATVREAAGTSDYRVDAYDLQDLLEKLKSRFGPKFAALVDTIDSDRVVVLLNGRTVHVKTGANLQLTDGDDVAIFPPVSGG